MVDPRDCLDFRDRGQWRAWLAANHATAAQAWVLHYKKGYERLGLTLDEAVEEALCFGWVDSVLSTVDEKCYALRYSPRRPDSIWSMRNIERVDRLIAAGKMAPAGRAAIDQAKANGQWAAAMRREQVDLIPAALARVMNEEPGAREAYEALSDSRKKQLIYFIEGARRPETKERRARKIVAGLLDAAGEP